MMHVTDADILRDVKRLIALRVKPLHDVDVVTSDASPDSKNI